MPEKRWFAILLFAGLSCLFAGLAVGVAERPTERVTPAPQVNPNAVVWRTPEPPTNPQPGDVWACPKDGGEMVYVPAGEFIMGSRDPNAFRHELREAYDLVAREIQAGRPCVIWGPYDPDFGIAVGVEGEKYLVESWKRVVGEPQPPVPFDQLVTPSGAYVLAFPTEVKMARAEADRRAIYHALDMLNYRTGDPQYATGQAAYDRWIAALETGKADAFGNSFNAQCWAEARRFAHEFLSRLAARNQRVAEPLRRAVTAYADVAEAIGDVASLFPFPDSRKMVEDPKRRAEAIQALRAAKAAEAKAAEAMAQAAADWPRE
jgi:hypothetical protein